MDFLKFIVSNQNEESVISIQSVKGGSTSKQIFMILQDPASTVEEIS